MTNSLVCFVLLHGKGDKRLFNARGNESLGNDIFQDRYFLLLTPKDYFSLNKHKSKFQCRICQSFCDVLQGKYCRLSNEKNLCA